MQILVCSRLQSMDYNKRCKWCVWTLVDSQPVQPRIGDITVKMTNQSVWEWQTGLISGFTSLHLWGVACNKPSSSTETLEHMTIFTNSGDSSEAVHMASVNLVHKLLKRTRIRFMSWMLNRVYSLVTVTKYWLSVRFRGVRWIRTGGKISMNNNKDQYYL